MNFANVRGYRVNTTGTRVWKRAAALPAWGLPGARPRRIPSHLHIIKRLYMQGFARLIHESPAPTTTTG